MNKKGYTLIETLATITILVIILLITVPRVKNLIEDSQIRTFESDVKTIIETAKLQYQTEFKGIIDTNIIFEYGIKDGKTYQTNIEEFGKLQIKGDLPSHGTIEITSDGDIIVNNLVDKKEKFCAIKSAEEKEATIWKMKNNECIND